MIRGLGILVVVCSLAAQAETPLSINTGFRPPVSDIYRLVIEEAFDRAEVAVDFREVAAERSIALANDGIDGGDCCRIAEIDQLYPNLLRVPVPVIDIDFVAFSRSPSLQLTKDEDWNALKPFEVGVVSGWKLLEVGLAEHPPAKIYTVSSPASLFSMLDKGRIQVATIGRLVGYRTILDMELSGIRVAEPPLVSRPLYLFLHRRHEELVPKLAKALQAMRNEGILDQYYMQIVEPLEEELEQAR